MTRVEHFRVCKQNRKERNIKERQRNRTDFAKIQECGLRNLENFFPLKQKGVQHASPIEMRTRKRK
jgi:hypothetical protein